MPCKHRFHSPCLETWLLKRASCPLCRSAMPIQEEAQTTNMVKGTASEQHGHEEDRDYHVL
ncbi:hypothetical protein GBA52_013569 [Prunus armeniaca]|nr:hypothetical protein GBA52_013569 [Prunus armeniaca]